MKTSRPQTQRQSAQRRHEAAVTGQQPGLQPDPTQPSNPNHPQQQAEQEVMRQQRQTATGLSVEFGD